MLRAFYAKVRPAGPGWARVRRESGLPPSPDSLPLALLGWVLGLASVYGALFAAGAFVYGRPVEGLRLERRRRGRRSPGSLVSGTPPLAPAAGPARAEG